MCCTGLSGTTCESPMCSGFGLAFGCDGPEDCGQTEVCCFAGISGVACAQPSACMGSGGLLDPQVVCVRDGDCPQGMGCCTAGLIASVLSDVDFGTCQTGCGGGMTSSSSGAPVTSSSDGASSAGTASSADSVSSSETAASSAGAGTSGPSATSEGTTASSL